MSSSHLVNVTQLKLAPLLGQVNTVSFTELIFKIGTFLVVAGLVKLVITGIYRIYFDELSHIPGPRLAAASKLWWVYYNVYPHNGKLCFLLPKLHEKYGPIIRISPTEVTIKDMDSYHEVHKFGSQFFKDPLTYAQPFINFLANGCLNNTIDHQTARHRRQAFAPYLRPQAIRNNDSIVHKHLNHLTDRLRNWGSKKPLSVQMAYRCMAGDIVSAVTYNGRLNFLDDDEFNPEYLQVAGSSSRLVGLIVSFRFLGDLMLFLVKATPKRYAPPAFKFLTQFRGMIARDVDALRESQQKIAVSDPKMGGINGESVFYRVIRDPQYHIPEHALISDALVFLAAGMDTTAHTLTLMTFHLLKNPPVLAKLMAEINAALPNLDDEATSSSLLQLPYLSATIKEALRMSTGVPNGMRRIVPETGHSVTGKHLPVGTVIIHPNYVSHFDEEVFPDAQAFKPERWIEASPAQYKEMDRNSNPFLRGARACLGINLAYSELYMATAHLFRRFKFSFVDEAEAEDNILNWVDQNLPQFKGPLRLYVEPRTE